MARIIALDVGEKRVGIAISDSLNLIAQGLEVTPRRDVFVRIKDLIKEYAVSRIIVGMPFNMNGTKGQSATKVEDFIKDLEKETPIAIETLDERLTTAQGEKVLLEADVSRKKRRLSIDKIAAQLILQAYLDSHAQKNNP